MLCGRCCVYNNRNEINRMRFVRFAYTFSATKIIQFVCFMRVTDSLANLSLALWTCAPAANYKLRMKLAMIREIRHVSRSFNSFIYIVCECLIALKWPNNERKSQFYTLNIVGIHSMSNFEMKKWWCKIKLSTIKLLLFS